MLITVYTTEHLAKSHGVCGARGCKESHEQLTGHNREHLRTESPKKRICLKIHTKHVSRIQNEG